MREIKFRAWVVNAHYGWLAQQGVHPEIDTAGKFLSKYEEHIIMQYTGLKDKNGKEIYEGDIVRVDEHYEGDHTVPQGIGEVKFEEAEWQILNDKAEHYLANYFGLWEAVNNYGCEIIGNIMENPELLK